MKVYLPPSMLALLLLAFAFSAPAFGRNVDLATVPDRETVQLTIYNSEDLTLVRETRRVSFKRGNNPLQFSWANTRIDSTSVELRFLEHPDQLVIMDTVFPHDRTQVLYWNVQSEIDGEALVEISYFTSGITWQADYVCIADHEESEMRFEGFVRVLNNSGEDYENAQIRLVVGEINLVEKIAQLAQMSIEQAENLSRQEMLKRRSDVMRRELMFLSDLPAERAGQSPAPTRPAEIIKEGLSEYFIYTIEGTETVPHGWSKRMRSFDGQTVPFDIQYRYRVPEYGDRLVRMYLLTNDEESNLGTTPLPDGTVRVFRENGRGGLSFLAVQQIKYVPIGDKIELNLGEDPRVPFELVKLRVRRDNIWMRIHGANIFRRVDDGAVDIDVRSSVAGWDDREVYSQRIRNYSPRTIEVEVRRQFSGHVIFRSELEPSLHDFRTVEFTATIEPGETVDLLFEIVRKQGRNAEQNNVTLEEAAVER